MTERADQPFQNLWFAIPVYNDWTSCRMLLKQLADDFGAAADQAYSVLLIDDGSEQDGAAELKTIAREKVERCLGVQVLRLARNVGHQRAIACGLCWIHEHQPDCAAVVVMDGDGEDQPRDVAALLTAMIAGGERGPCRPIVFAERMRRSEGVRFQGGYIGYRLLHRVLTGIPVRFGNFSIIPRNALSRVVLLSELWNHYAAAVVRARISYTTVPTERGLRLAGRSHMDYFALAIHGITALSVFADIIAIRLLFAMVGAGGIALVLFAFGVVFGQIQIPATYLTLVILGCLMLIVQMASNCVALVHALAASRSGAMFVPARDYHVFVAGVDQITH